MPDQTIDKAREEIERIKQVVADLAAVWPSEDIPEDADVPEELRVAHNALNREMQAGHAGKIAQLATETAAWHLLVLLEVDAMPDGHSLELGYGTGVNPSAAQMGLSWVMSAAKKDSSYIMATFFGGFHHTMSVYVQGLFDLIAALRDGKVTAALVPSEEGDRPVEDVEVTGGEL